MSGWTKAASIDELTANEGKCVTVVGQEIALFFVDGEYYALADACPHVGASMAEGAVDCGEVVCPWHGARFQLKDGALLQGPAREGLKAYNVKIEDGSVFIELT